MTKNDDPSDKDVEGVAGAAEAAGATGATGAAEAAEAAERRRRRDRVFGTVLPEGTRDDTSPDEPGDPGAARRGVRERSGVREGSDAAHEEWLRNNVPPHHG